MQSKGALTIIHEKKVITIPSSNILYVIMDGNNALIRLSQDKSYRVRMTLSEIEPVLGDDFIKVKRGCIVSVRAIHDFTDKVNLINGESLDYAARSKKEIVEKFHAKQQYMISRFNEAVTLSTDEEYREYYKVFDNLPVAFCDIEMVFDSEFNAVDWIFRYGNNALAEIEKHSLSEIIGCSFGTLFNNMDRKWLKNYEQAALFGETVRVVDYSPEIDAYLDIVCFPTFKGHCGCIMFDIDKINSCREATDAERAMAVYFKRLFKLD